MCPEPFTIGGIIFEYLKLIEPSPQFAPLLQQRKLEKFELASGLYNPWSLTFPKKSSPDVLHVVFIISHGPGDVTIGKIGYDDGAANTTGIKSNTRTNSPLLSLIAIVIL
jgi:hypothetical protein